MDEYRPPVVLTQENRARITTISADFIRNAVEAQEAYDWMLDAVALRLVADVTTRTIRRPAGARAYAWQWVYSHTWRVRWLSRWASDRIRWEEIKVCCPHLLGDEPELHVAYLVNAT
jgi:hypothetical protein